MEEQTALLANFEKYGFKEVICGFVEPSSTFNPLKKQFGLGDGRWLDVDTNDLVIIELTDTDKSKLFPLYD